MNGNAKETTTPIIEENSPSSAAWRPASTNSAGMMTLPLAPTMPRRSSLYQKRAQQGFAQEKRRRRAWKSRRRGHRPSGTRGKHPRAEQTCKDGAERRQPERWRSAKQADCGPPRAGPPRIATFPITAFSDETRSTESPATWPRFGQLTVLRGHTGCVERGTEHHASDQPSVRGRQRHRAVGCSPWPRRPHTRDQCDGRAPEPIDEATTNPRADDGRDDAASGRGARPGRALCMRQDEPWKREGRHRVADPEERSPRTASRAGYIDVRSFRCGELRLRRSEVLFVTRVEGEECVGDRPERKALRDVVGEPRPPGHRPLHT